MFKFSQYKAHLLFVILPVIFILSMIVTFLVRVSLDVCRNSAVWVSRIASEYLDTEVRVDKLSLVWLDRVYLRDITLYEQHSDRILLTSSQVTVNLSPAAIFSGNYISSIQSVTAEGISGSVRRLKDGSSNIDFLIHRPQKKEKSDRLRTVIYVRNADVAVSDEITGMKEHFTRLSSRVNMQRPDSVSVNSRLDMECARNLFVVFQTDTLTGRYSLDTNIGSLDLSRLAPLYPSGATRVSGSVKGYAGVSGRLAKLSEPERVSCSLKIANAGGAYSGYSLEGLSGYLQCRNTRSVVYLNGAVNGIPFTAKGTGLSVSRDLFRPALEMSVSLRKVSLAGVKSHIPALAALKSLPSLGGEMDMSLVLKGTLQDPTVRVRTRIRNGSFADYRFRDSMVYLEYGHSTVNTEIKLKLDDSSVWLCGTCGGVSLSRFDPSKTRLALRGNLVCNDVSDYLPDNPYGISGKVMSEYYVTGSLTDPRAVANLSALRSGFFVNKQEIRDVELSTAVSYDKARGITFDRLIIKNFLDANIMLSAEIKDPSHITGRAYVSELQLSRLMAFLGKSDVDIRGDLAFVGGYKLRSGQVYLNGECELYDFSYNTYKIDYLNCLFDASRDLVTVKNMALLAVPSQVGFSGIIRDPLSSRPTFKGDFAIQNADALTVCRIFDYTMTTPMEGVVNGTLAINGMLDMSGNQFRFRDLSGAGSLDFNDLMIDKYPFDYLHVDALVSDNTVYFNDIDGRASVFNAIDDNKFTRVTGNGYIDLKDYGVKGDLLVSDVNISDFRGYFSDYVNASGLCDLTVSVDGYMNSLNVTCNGAFRRVTFNGKNYSNVTLSASLLHSESVALDLFMEKDPETLHLYAEDYNIRTRSVGRAGLNADNISAIELLELYSMSPLGVKDESRKFLSYLPSLTGGDINAELEINGSIDSLSGKGSLTGTDIICGSEHMQNMNLELEMDKGVINMPDLTLEFPDIYITADAYPLYDKDKRTNTNLSVINLPVSRVSNYTSVKNLDGLLTVDALIEGRITSPSISASLDLQHPSYNGIRVDRISAGKIVLDGDKLDFSKGLKLLIGDYSAVVYGSVPWDSETMRPDRDGELDIHFDMDRQNLAFADTLYASNSTKPSDGIFDSHISVTGSIAKPVIEGYVNIEEGTVCPAGTLTLNNINGNVTLSNNGGTEPLLITFRDCSFSDDQGKPNACVITDGSYIRVASLQDSEMDISCIFDDYHLDAGGITSYQEKIRGTINGTLTASGSLSAPLITDNGTPVTVDKLYCSVAKLSQKTEEDTDMDDSIKAARENTELMGFAGPPPAPRPARSFDPVFDINLRADNCDIRPPMTKISCDTSATIKGTLSDPDIAADGVVRSGRVLLHVARLRINKGSNVRFTYADHTPDAILDASAFTDVRTTDKLGINNSYRVTVNLSGSIKNMNMEMTSDPEGLNETEILSAIGKFGISKNGLTGNSYEFNPVNMAASVGISTIMSPIEDFFVDTMGVDVLSFDYMDKEYALVNIEKTFGKRYFISFYQNFLNTNSSSSHTGISKWELKAGAKLFNKYRLTLGTNDNHEVKAEISFGMSF
ncbi:MAG: translocation/assembly module TamB domain-containing protein [Abditibacteriota bacterium]|nr:translocation/assembly module TamB domain-containing protein [Abditibacteriota bacterium]